MGKKTRIIGIILLMLLSSAATYFGTTLYYNYFSQSDPAYSITFSPNTVQAESIDKFKQARDLLKGNYYEDVSDDVLLEGAVAGMAYSLKDPYTVYYTKEQMQSIVELSQKSEETYSGIGVSIALGADGLVTIIEPFEGSPAFLAGIKQGDKIIEVDGKDVTGLKDESAIVEMIKGPGGTAVKITVYRPSEGRSIDFDIIRKTIKIELNIRSSILKGNIGYIKIISFLDNNIGNIFNEQLKKLMDSGIKGLIIDVRDNPGGSYDQVVNIADRLLPEGVIVYTEDRNKNVEKKFSDNIFLDLPMAILVNGNSASASEILAGAVGDFGKGVLVGAKTFGKGLVQNLIYLDDGSGIKVTIARYFTPSGTSIHGIGIMPDFEVTLPEKYNNTPASQVPQDEDTQLQKALEILTK